MRLDARIPVQVVASDHEPTPSGDTLLVRLGVAAADSPAGGPLDGAADVPGGWAAVRCLPETAISDHGAACTCCAGRSGLAETLGMVFVQRARAELPWFGRVVLAARPERLHDVVTILQDDGLVSGRFRDTAEK